MRMPKVKAPITAPAMAAELRPVLFVSDVAAEGELDGRANPSSDALSTTRLFNVSVATQRRIGQVRTRQAAWLKDRNSWGRGHYVDRMSGGY